MAAPKPDGQRRRRNATPGFIQLDPKGRQEPAPPWPIIDNAIPEIEKLELERWEELWKLPQAIEWERVKCFADVAIYCRIWVTVSTGLADARMISELRQLDATIGVSPKAMQGLRWEIPQSLEEDAEAKPVLRSVDRKAYVPGRAQDAAAAS